MKKEKSYAPRELRIKAKGMFIILATLSLVSMVYACKFWGFYDYAPLMADDDVRDRALHMCTLANNDDDGWSVLSYTHGSSPSDVYVERTDDDIQAGNCQAGSDFGVYVRGEAASDKTLIMAHARLNSPRFGQDLIDNPHPFLYEQRIDDFLALAHNGGFTNVCGIQDVIGAGFAAINTFVKRPYTTWYDEDDPCYPDLLDPSDPCETIVDTEYYTVLLKRQLLIAQNYYLNWDDPWEVTGINDVSYAINSTANLIDNAAISYSSLNAEIATNDELWAFYKRSPSDLYTHNLSVYQGNGDFREVITESNTGVGWTNFTGLGRINAKYILLEPGIVNTPVLIDSSMADSSLHPTELRINGRDNSEGQQLYPAIAADPVHGTFAVVWDDGEANHIKLRWYNQMGLAETPEIEVNNTTCIDVAEPAVAISPESGRVFVVWTEREIGTTVYTIQYRTFIWDPDNYEWMGSLTGIIMSGAGETCSHPAIAVREDDTFAVVWGVSLAGVTTIHYAAFSPGGSVVDQVLSVNAQGHTNTEPDITAFMDGSDNSYAVVWEYYSTRDVLGPRVNARIIKEDDGTLGSIQTLYQAASGVNVSKLNPAVESSVTTDDLFAVGYYTGSMMGNFVSANSLGVISITNTYTGETPLAVKTGPHIDVACRSTGQMEICYDKSISGTYDVVLAESGVSDFINLEVVNTTTTGSQLWPAIAISQEYICTSDNGDDYYGDMSVDSPFNTRRMIVWHSYEQDGDLYGIVGRFTAIVDSDDDREPWWTEDIVSDAIGCCDELSKSYDPGEPEASDVSRYIDSDMLDDENALTPTEFKLYAPCPNPFNPTTTLSFDLPEATEVSLNVYDLSGRLVSTLVSGYTAAGSHSITFDGTNLSTGTYFVRMSAGSFVRTQKLLLVK